MTKKDKIEKELSDYNNSLRFFYYPVNGVFLEFEIVGTCIENGCVHTIKMPYYELDWDGDVKRWSRYKEKNDKEIKEIVNRYPEQNKHLVKHYNL